MNHPLFSEFTISMNCGIRRIFARFKDGSIGEQRKRGSGLTSLESGAGDGNRQQ
jgi:hypothetical protein